MRADTSPGETGRAGENGPADAPGEIGVAPLPDGTDRDDALAALYAWPPAAGPVVRGNMIASLDGGAAVAGRSGGLGNAADQHLFGLLRDLAEVILVGSGTVRAEQYAGIPDEPDRAARRQRWGLPAAPPPIAVVTGRGLDPDLPLFAPSPTPPIIVTTARAAGVVPATARVVVAGDESVDLAAAITALHDLGYRRIHCEGGPSLLGRLIVDELLDECCLTLAPMLLGSAATRLLPTALADPVGWTPLSLRIAGGHLFARYRRTGR